MPSARRKKTIFWFEDDPWSSVEHCEALRKQYDVIIGAERDRVEQLRKKPVDLVIVDLIIYPQSENEAREVVDNVAFEGINHHVTGVEFLRRLRAGEYAAYGFLRDAPVIVLTAVADNTIQERARQYAETGSPSRFLEKPVKLDELKAAVAALLDARKEGM